MGFLFFFSIAALFLLFKNEKQNLRLVACKTGNARILKESLKNRYDENDAKWTGYNQIKLNRSLTKLV